jgi:hypothetical protein
MMAATALVLPKQHVSLVSLFAGRHRMLSHQESNEEFEALELLVIKACFEDFRKAEKPLRFPRLKRYGRMLTDVRYALW